MTKSDHELGELLRETFAGQEHQVDHLPEAIKTEAADRRAGSGVGGHAGWGPGRSGDRRFIPVLAGAAVVIVLGGAFVVRQNLPQPTVLPAPAATTSAPTIGPGGIVLTEDIRIWAAAVKGMIEREPGAAAYIVVNAPQENEGAVRGEPFTDAEKIAITGLVAPTKLKWIHERPATSDPCSPDAGGPYITVGAIVRTAGHVEVDASIWRGCQAGRWLTFRLDQKTGEWKITGTVGPEAIS